MNIFAKTAMLALSMLAPVPALAQAGVQPDWWLVLDERSNEVAHFVDLASVEPAIEGTAVTVLIFRRDGRRYFETRTIDCRASLGALTEADIQAFLCGSDDYRVNNGLNAGSASPEDVAALLFNSSATPGPAPSNEIASGNFPAHGTLSI